MPPTVRRGYTGGQAITVTRRGTAAGLATNVTHQTGYGGHVLMLAHRDVLQPETRRELLRLFQVVPALPPALWDWHGDSRFPAG